MRGRCYIARICAALALAALALLIALPEARFGALALANRLFELSEARNNYIYARFDIPAGQSDALAKALAAVLCAAWGGVVFSARHRWPALFTALLAAGVQSYFGVSLPTWGNALLLGGLALALLKRPARWRTALCFALAAALLVALISALLPGVNAGIEAASERVRDALSWNAQLSEGSAAEAPAEGIETRHVNTRTLLSGEERSRAGDSFRLVTVEEQQISQPEWIDYLRTAMIALLALALLILPFVPFAVINARRRKALEAREVFDSDDVNAAVRAMFRCVIAWHEATGGDMGNRLYRDWPGLMRGRLPAEYAARF